MFIALVFIYKFVVVGTIFKLRGSLLFHPRRFWRQELTVSQQSKSTPCFYQIIVTLFSILFLWFLSQISLHCYIWGFIVYLFYTIDFLFCIYMVFPL